MKIVIWIHVQLIWIRILEKVWTTAHQQSDSNPSSMDSNLNSSKRHLDGLIRITIQVIQIPSEKEVKLRATDSNHLYSDSNHLYSDSNHLYSNSNPSWRTSQEIETRIQITYTAIWIPKSRLIKYKTRRFESLHKLKQKAESRTERFEFSSYRFESLLGTKFKYCKGDSNHLNNDSNHLLCRSIYCSTCSCNNLTFNSNLSHNG